MEKLLRHCKNFHTLRLRNSSMAVETLNAMAAVLDELHTEEKLSRRSDDPRIFQIQLHSDCVEPVRAQMVEWGCRADRLAVESFSKK